jgi:sulfite oxidase
MMDSRTPLQNATTAADDERERRRASEFRLSRRMLVGSSLAAIGASAGFGLPPGGVAWISQASAQGAPAAAPAAKTPPPFDFPGKDKGLVVLGDRPLVAETPESLLNDDTTPTGKFFIRNNGQIPQDSKKGDAWSFKVEGEVDRPLTLTLAELKSRFKPQTRRMVMECGGNGRSFFQPAARGNQWTNGGAGCAEWTGVSLADVLKAAGLRKDGKYTGHFAADPHLSGDAGKDAISRGMPIEKALEPNTMLVWAMNGEPLAHIHGGPLRLIVPGWPGSLSSKWLTRVLVRKDPHDGQGMGGTSYRVPTVPIVPGSNVDGKTNFTDLTSMPTRSIITAPANGARLATGTRVVPVRGAAWAGDYDVRRVEVSADAGQRWQPMTMAKPRNRYDWVRWTGTLKLPSDGYFELWVRATDSRGVAQPHVATNWNPQGYGSNPFHRIAVLVG